VFTKRIHVFKAGDQTSAQGVQRTFSPKDLQQVVDTYDPSIHEAPLVIGHQGDSDSLPSYGWIKGFARQGSNLYADVEFTNTAKDLVKDGHYRKVSISFYSPDSQINPHSGKWSARHLALLGAAPPAVKGLEPFSFREQDGVFDYATALDPSELFDEELGPTLIIEKSPLEMLKERLEEVRNEVSNEVAGMKQGQAPQPETNVSEAAAPQDSEDLNQGPDEASPAAQFSETKKKMGRQGTEIAQQTAGLEDNLPEESFMEDGKISRKRANGAHGQVMQVVENVYDEQHKEGKAERKEAADRGFERKRQMAEGKRGEAHETEELMKMKDKKLSDEHGEMPEAFKKNMGKMKDKAMSDDHKELTPGQRKMDKNKNGRIDGEDMKMLHNDHAELEYDEVSYKTNPSQGVVKFGKKKEGEADPSGRMETARNTTNGYADRMSVGKEGADGATGRFKTARSGEQDMDRMTTTKNGNQDADRFETAKADMEEGVGEDRWAGQPEAEERIENMDQYDLDANSYPEPNRPKKATGSNPAGREDSMTKFPTETEEMPDDEVFAVGMENVKNSRDSRVMYIKGGEAMPSPKGGPITHAFSEDEMEMDSEDPSRYMQGQAKFKKGQLDPGQFEGGVAQISGPDGVFAESYRGEKKSSERQLTPGAMDETDDPAQITGPDGVYAENQLGKKKDVRKGKGSEGDFEGGTGETTLRSGGVYAEDMDDDMDSQHSEKSRKDPYTKTGFGSTYDEDGEEETGDDFNELSADHCGMNYGMGSMAQPKADGYPSQMFEEMKQLKSEMAELQRRYNEEKTMNRRRMMHSFVENLYEEGRLTDGVIPQEELVSYCEGLEFGTLEFAEGETPATKLLGLLSKLPPMVHYGEVTAGGTFQFAEEDLDPHAKALKMVEASEGKMDYVEALKKTMFS